MTKPTNRTNTAREISRRILESAAHHANLVMADIQELSREPGVELLLSDETTKLLRHILEAEFFEAVKMGAVIAVTDGAVRAKLASAVPHRAGKRSGEVRAALGQKARFIAWALDRKKTSPKMSKNELAQRYAELFPQASVSTLRRYLAAISIAKD